MDKILESRKNASCSKVTLVAHSGAANQAACMALEPGMSDKVGKLVTLAPCINTNIGTFAVKENDLPAYYAVYDVFEQFGIKSFFGPGFEQQSAQLCTASPDFCNYYLN